VKKQKKNVITKFFRSTFHFTDRIVATAAARIAAVHAESSKTLQVPLHQERKYSIV